MAIMLEPVPDIKMTIFLMGEGAAEVMARQIMTMLHVAKSRL
jgi:hypothetical protein